ncbi:MAG TPA: UDP-N-acetylglucosamine 2-epimerase (non-hydrolyzing) [Nitrososphaeraceae archaeon]|jgi:UDP-N-acetylglucosamine 2-epimerase
MDNKNKTDQLQVICDPNDTESTSRNASDFSVITVAGTRPELIKLSEFIQLFDKTGHGLLYTGQHFSPKMKDVFLEQLGIFPDFDLQCGTSEVSMLEQKIYDTLKKSKPNFLIVYGDTNSSLAASLAAKKLGSKIIHVEAGVRDFDLAVPEEITRIKIDAMSDLLLAPSDFCKMCLSYEDIRGYVRVTGNLIVDVCRKLSKIATKPADLDLPDQFILLTMHRPENVDDPVKLKLLSKHLSQVESPVVFPIHPRTQASMKRHSITLPPNVRAIEPVGYLEFLYLLNRCQIVLTDSGGVQEESIVLKKPCLTLRHTSARWETILLNANRLFPLDRDESLTKAISDMCNVKITVNPYGENVAVATYKAIQEYIS